MMKSVTFLTGLLAALALLLQPASSAPSTAPSSNPSAQPVLTFNLQDYTLPEPICKLNSDDDVKCDFTGIVPATGNLAYSIAGFANCTGNAARSADISLPVATATATGGDHSVTIDLKTNFNLADQASEAFEFCLVTSLEDVNNKEMLYQGQKIKATFTADGGFTVSGITSVEFDGINAAVGEDSKTFGISAKRCDVNRNALTSAPTISPSASPTSLVPAGLTYVGMGNCHTTQGGSLDVCYLSSGNANVAECSQLCRQYPQGLRGFDVFYTVIPGWCNCWYDNGQTPLEVLGYIPASFTDCNINPSGSGPIDTVLPRPDAAEIFCYGYDPTPPPQPSTSPSSSPTYLAVPPLAVGTTLFICIDSTDANAVIKSVDTFGAEKNGVALTDLLTGNTEVKGEGTDAVTIGTRPFVQFFDDIAPLKIVGTVTLEVTDNGATRRHLVRILQNGLSEEFQNGLSEEFELEVELEAVEESSANSAAFSTAAFALLGAIVVAIM